MPKPEKFLKGGVSLSSNHKAMYHSVIHPTTPSVAPIQETYQMFLPTKIKKGLNFKLNHDFQTSKTSSNDLLKSIFPLNSTKQ